MWNTVTPLTPLQYWFCRILMNLWSEKEFCGVSTLRSSRKIKYYIDMLGLWSSTSILPFKNFSQIGTDSVIGIPKFSVYKSTIPLTTVCLERDRTISSAVPFPPYGSKRDSRFLDDLETITGSPPLDSIYRG